MNTREGYFSWAEIGLTILPGYHYRINWPYEYKPKLNTPVKDDAGSTIGIISMIIEETNEVEFIGI